MARVPRPAARAPAQRFELALSGYEPRHREELERRGWRVRDALDFDGDLDAYRDYIARLARRSSRSPRTRTSASAPAGSATAARPTWPPAGRSITQDTGFGDVLPTGEGLFAVRDLDEAAAAVEAIAADSAAPPPRGRRDRPRALRRRARARRPAGRTWIVRPQAPRTMSTLDPRPRTAPRGRAPRSTAGLAPCSR